MASYTESEVTDTADSRRTAATAAALPPGRTLGGIPLGANPAATPGGGIGWPAESRPAMGREAADRERGCRTMWCGWS